MRIRLASTTDVSAIEALMAAAYTHYVARIGRPPAPMSDDYRARVAAHCCWIAEEGGDLVGAIVLEQEASALEVNNVAVAPGWQGKGIGRALLRFAEDEARRRGLHRLTLYTNVKMTENLVLYARLGWRETGRATQYGFERVFFDKQL